MQFGNLWDGGCVRLAGYRVLGVVGVVGGVRSAPFLRDFDKN